MLIGLKRTIPSEERQQLGFVTTRTAVFLKIARRTAIRTNPSSCLHRLVNQPKSPRTLGACGELHPNRFVQLKQILGWGEEYVKCNRVQETELSIKASLADSEKAVKRVTHSAALHPACAGSEAPW